MTQPTPRTATPRGTALIATAAVTVVVAVALAYIAFGLATARTTLGCDYFTYADAAERHLVGDPIYPSGPARTGECGLYQYSPPFLLLLYPFVVLGAGGLWAWIGASLAAFAVGCAVMPVRRSIRFGVFFVGAVGWPFIFSLRIGQVGPLLFLLFALGWRFMHRPIALGTMVGLGAIIKLQPALLVAWLALRLNRRALIAALATVTFLTVLGAAVGLIDWPSFVRIVRDISNAVDVPANLSIGATLYQFGMEPGLAGAIQTANTVVLLGVVVWASRVLRSVPSYLALVTASQIVSPIVWSHYALILLLPVAWLLDRRLWWAALVPFVHVWVLLPFVPSWTYPLVFYVVLTALLVVGWRARVVALPSSAVTAHRLETHESADGALP